MVYVNRQGQVGAVEVDSVPDKKRVLQGLQSVPAGLFLSCSGLLQFGNLAGLSFLSGTEYEATQGFPSNFPESPEKIAHIWKNRSQNLDQTTQIPGF